MRIVPAVCALAAYGGVALAQLPDSSRATTRPAAPTGNTRQAAAPATGQPTDSLHLTRAAAIAEALHRNPQLEVAREQTSQARARRVSAVAIPDPSLQAAYDDESRLFGFNGAGARNVTVGMAVPFPDKFRLQNAVAVGDIHASESNYQLQRQLIALGASAAYDSLLLARRHRADLLEGRQLALDFLKRTEARFEAGTAARLDVIKARVDVAQAETDLIANERDIATAQGSLNRLVGRPVSTPIAPVDSLTMPADLPDSATIEQVALARRPELASLESQRQGARAATALTREYWLPDITLGVTRDYKDPAGSPLFTTGLALPLPAFFWQHSRGETAQAVHFERELAATARDLRAEVAQDVRSAYATASTSMRQVTFLRDQLVPAAREAFRVASTSYALGGSSALEVLDARRVLLDAQNQLAEALAAANTARADLDRALGVAPSPDGTRAP